MPNPTAYKIKRLDRSSNKELSLETIVYDCLSYDYGLAQDDSRGTGIPHISVTLNSDGSYPSFTIPLADLEKVDSASKKPHKGRISFWFRVHVKDGYRINGLTEGHPDFPDETFLTTSLVINRVEGEIETKNSRYTLIGKAIKL